MLTVICVLRSGGIYDESDVVKLQHQVARHMSQSHRFVCLSDIDVPCDRIAMQHNWPGWWSKIELFRPGVVTQNTIYLDLDNVILDDFSMVAQCGHDFAMMQNLGKSWMASSALMWFGAKIPVEVYKRFVVEPDKWLKYYQIYAKGTYVGDQAFIWDSLDRSVPLLGAKEYGIKSYRRHILGLDRPPKNTRIVCFGGKYKPRNVNAEWLKAAWR